MTPGYAGIFVFWSAGNDAGRPRRKCASRRRRWRCRPHRSGTAPRAGPPLADRAAAAAGDRVPPNPFFKKESSDGWSEDGVGGEGVARGRNDEKKRRRLACRGGGRKERGDDFSSRSAGGRLYVSADLPAG